MSKKNITIRLSDKDISDLDFMAEVNDTTRTDVIRELISLVRILYDERLGFREAINEKYHDKRISEIDESFSNVMKPIQILSKIIFYKTKKHFFGSINHKK